VKKILIISTIMSMDLSCDNFSEINNNNSNDSNYNLIYSNTLDNDSLLLDFTTEGFVRIIDKQLLLKPSFTSRTFAVSDSTKCLQNYSSTLKKNKKILSWEFNISNNDSMYNNTFSVVLACNRMVAYDVESKGYAFSGGGMVGSRFGITRFDYGLGGGQKLFIDVTGLGTLPEKGSIRVTFEPDSSIWKLYAVVSPTYHDPQNVTTLIGMGVDSTYTRRSLPYFGFTSNNLGSTFIDNFSIKFLDK